jgi:hypothetical protein
VYSVTEHQPDLNEKANAKSMTRQPPLLLAQSF